MPLTDSQSAEVEPSHTARTKESKTQTPRRHHHHHRHRHPSKSSAAGLNKGGNAHHEIVHRGDEPHDSEDASILIMSLKKLRMPSTESVCTKEFEEEEEKISAAIEARIACKQISIEQKMEMSDARTNKELKKGMLLANSQDTAVDSTRPKRANTRCNLDCHYHRHHHHHHSKTSAVQLDKDENAYHENILRMNEPDHNKAANRKKTSSPEWNKSNAFQKVRAQNSYDKESLVPFSDGTVPRKYLRNDLSSSGASRRKPGHQHDSTKKGTREEFQNIFNSSDTSIGLRNGEINDEAIKSKMRDREKLRAHSNTHSKLNADANLIESILQPTRHNLPKESSSALFQSIAMIELATSCKADYGGPAKLVLASPREIPMLVHQRELGQECQPTTFDSIPHENPGAFAVQAPFNFEVSLSAPNVFDSSARAQAFHYGDLESHTGLESSNDASFADRNVTFEAQLVDEEIVMAEILVWHKRPLYRWIFLIGIVLLIAVTGLVVRQTTLSHATQQENEIVCNFLSLQSIECETTTHFEGNTAGSAIPTEIGILSQLVFLDLKENNLRGSIPTEIGKLTQLTYLSLNKNELTGTIPSEVGQLRQLTLFTLNQNDLNGAIPSEVGQLTQLTLLNLNKNDLTGKIPSHVNSLSLLRGLYLQSNEFTGSIPALSSLTYMVNLTFTNNHLSGAVPASLSSLTRLESLWLDNNDLQGTIPAELCQRNAGIFIDCGTIECNCCKSGSSNNYGNCSANG